MSPASYSLPPANSPNPEPRAEPSPLPIANPAGPVKGVKAAPSAVPKALPAPLNNFLPLCSLANFLDCSSNSSCALVTSLCKPKP